MGSDAVGPITELLVRWSAGEADCLTDLIPLVEGELRRIAHRHMRRERKGHTLQTTALVNEAYIKLVDQARPTYPTRVQFCAAAAGIMRRILVDHARGQHRQKRGGVGGWVLLDENIAFSAGKSAALVALDDALDELARLDPRKARVVELRYFCGLSVEETAEALGVHPNTVIRDWALSRGWLTRELNCGTRNAG